MKFFENKYRRGRDSNPRTPLERRHISNVLPSATRAPLLLGVPNRHLSSEEYLNSISLFLLKKNCLLLDSN